MIYCIILASGLVLGAHVLQVSPTSFERLSNHPFGSALNPFTEIARAVDTVRALRAVNHEVGVIEVLLAPGVYSSFSLSAIDSGQSEEERTIFRGKQGQTIINAGKEIPSSLFQPTLPVARSSNTQAYVADLSSLNIPFSSFGTFQAGGFVDSCAHDRSELSFNGVPMILARWPNVDQNGIYQYQNADNGTVGALILNTTRVPDFKRVLNWQKGGNGTDGEGKNDGMEPEPWLHGYWEWDWADCYRAITQITQQDDIIQVMFDPPDQTPIHNARFYGVNLLSELDVPGEYYLDIRPPSASASKQLLYFIPPEGSGLPSQWKNGPILSFNESAIDVSETSFISLEQLTIVNSKGTGIIADHANGLKIIDCNVMLHGQDGIHMFSAVNSTIENSVVKMVGCAGIRAHGGNASDLTKGNLLVRNNSISDFARWKRTYQAGIHWSGVSNSYSENVIQDAPHVCILGGGNEADDDSLGGVDCLFDSNQLSHCVYEGSDAGAFYTCGQSGTAFVNRNNTIINSLFTNIHGLRGDTQAIYLDDQMSGWSIIENKFIDCDVGSFIGGGRDNIVARNYYQNCTLAQHFDNRGMNWEQTSCNCTQVCEPRTCICNPGAASWMVTKSVAAKVWAARFPSMVNIDHICAPAHNIIQNNTYCKCANFINAALNDTLSWFSVVQNNTEIHSC